MGHPSAPPGTHVQHGQQMGGAGAATPNGSFPKISLDLNALSSGQEVQGLPFSGFDFLGSDLYALVRPPTEQPNAQMFEQNAQVLWQAYGQGDVAFGHGGQPGPA